MRPPAQTQRRNTQVQTAARYAHFAAEPVKQAADDISTTIGAALEGEVAH